MSNSNNGLISITGKFKSGKARPSTRSRRSRTTSRSESYLSYSVSASLLGLVSLKKDEPMTMKVTRTILLLPEEAMRPRLADDRSASSLTGLSRIDGKKETIEDFSVINRWDLQPKDVEAWKRGELVEPVKPIVFYLDDAFLELQWRDPIRRGVLRWNKAFEKIGFKNVMHIEDFPKDDPEFDPRQPEIPLHPLCPGSRGQRHGPLVGRSALGRDHQCLGADVQRRGAAGQHVALRADLAGRRERARQGAPRRRFPGNAGIHPRP